MLYIVSKRIEEESLGVVKKIMGQNEAFVYSGLESKVYRMTYYKDNHFFAKIARRLIGFNLHKHWRMDDFLSEDCMYIRRAGIWDKAALNFFCELKNKKSKLKIVYELPTYPYDGEIKKHWYNYPLFWKDKWNRRHIHKFIDRIATLTDDKEIFGVPTLKIGNGIDVDKIRPRQARESEEIHAIAVANFEWWHGYDRFIEGLKAYYAGKPERKVIFHLVGHGGEFGRYQKMVTDYRLEDYVILHDQQTGEALDAIYDQCNLGIASLGFHRTGLTEGAPIKTREYLAKGLPFIFGAKVSDISEEDKGSIYLQVPADDSPIDIENVLKFYDHIYRDGMEQVNDRLRQFAQDHFSMEVAMKEVIDFFKEGK